MPFIKPIKQYSIELYCAFKTGNVSVWFATFQQSLHFFTHPSRVENCQAETWELRMDASLYEKADEYAILAKLKERHLSHYLCRTASLISHQLEFHNPPRSYERGRYAPGRGSCVLKPAGRIPCSLHLPRE